MVQAGDAATADVATQERERVTKVGRVVSDKMNKTVVVAVDYSRRHPLYNKVMNRTSRFQAHDENNECRTGDLVRIEESRPLSRHKRWVVREILEAVERPEGQ